MEHKFFPNCRSNKLTLTGMAIILIFTFVAISAPWISPHCPSQINLSKRLMSPGITYPMGTDHLGRCVLSRTLYGTRYTLGVSSVILLIVLVISTAVGSISGYYGGLVDEITMRIVDMLLAFPPIIPAITIVGLLGPGLLNLLMAMSFIWWVGVSRVIRGLVLSVKEREFIEAARALGAKNNRIIFLHILPNIIPSIMVLLSLEMGGIILSISGLSFIGLGAMPPTPEWGSMLSEGYIYMETAPHLMIFPGAAITLSVMGFHLLGEGLRDSVSLKGPQREINRFS